MRLEAPSLDGASRRTLRPRGFRAVGVGVSGVIYASSKWLSTSVLSDSTCRRAGPVGTSGIQHLPRPLNCTHKHSVSMRPSVILDGDPCLKQADGEPTRGNRQWVACGVTGASVEARAVQIHPIDVRWVPHGVVERFHVPVVPSAHLQSQATSHAVMQKLSMRHNLAFDVVLTAETCIE